MKKTLELPWQQIKTSYELPEIDDTAMSQLVDDTVLLAEQETLDMLTFALQLKSKGYHLYISGEDQASIWDYTVQQVQKLASQERVPDDLCYIYNFKEPSEPQYLFMKAGEGMKLHNDLQELRHFLIEELSECLQNYEAERKRDKLMKELEKRRNVLLDQLDEEALEMGFTVEVTKEGIGFIPLDEAGNEIAREAYEQFDTAQKTIIEQKVELLYDALGEVMEQVKQLEKTYRTYLDNLNEEIMIEQIGSYTGYLRKTYEAYPQVVAYVDAIRNDILEHIALFESKETDEAQSVSQLIPWVSTKTADSIVKRYDVKVLVDNTAQKGAPVVAAKTMSYSELLGRIKVDQEGGSLHTDFMNIYAGLVQQANGGYLILSLQDVIEAPGAWEAIKKILKTEQMTMESLRGPSIITALDMVPESCPIDVKVIMIGQSEGYDLLQTCDAAFLELFKLHIAFGETVSRTPDTVRQFVKLVKRYCDSKHLRPISKQGIGYLLACNQYQAQRKTRLATNMQPTYALLQEAQGFGQGKLTRHELEQAKHMKETFKYMLERNIDENYLKETVLVRTDGKAIGQINGLVVWTIEHYQFGRPVRITATTCKGQPGIVDIETVSGLSGKLHTKGVQILNGFLGHYFAQEEVLSLTCRICLEQSYGGVDGDSASSAELYAILSSMASIPIEQGIAVTGSINQYGEIQPIGAINEKIEGFYRICKQKGMTGRQGVMIPIQNKDEVMLSDEVVAAVQAGNFHIYAVRSYREGMAVLTGMPYEEVEKRIKMRMKEYNRYKKQSKTKK